LWVQGQGWLEAENVKVRDVLSGKDGDSLVIANYVINNPIKVYNFSVNKTTSYFVGKSGLWAHNCDVTFPYQAAKSPSGYKIGASDGGPGKWKEIGRPDDENYAYQRQISGAPKNIEYEVGGKKFDGYDADRGVLIEAKRYGEKNALVKGGPDFLIKTEINDIISEAEIAALNGHKFEIHVSGEVAANAIKQQLAKRAADGYRASDDAPAISVKTLENLKVIHTPDIVN